ncbi:DNA-binding response regulator [Cohnella xylanilytica]|uniref:Response regulator n=1 Tax=Cohnella xylanilytica TaxID=557555 RepID=A0A841U603_9BACL|nr:response regulator [Cohnella xylanilytica]MBB6693440.1 response regulator [Cohnella xylanilytica]GIO16123.1 DNA-binding response regulator [Cohnella xylanilytica]
MWKVMLVDDEIVIRENIRECVDWEREGFVYCGDASDGELALPLIEQTMPDILITDIKMPFLDGLELSAIVRKRMPDVKIVILSGHDEFEYARSALRLGVEEYCLKPVSAAELVALLRSVGAKIDRERREKERLERLGRGEAERALPTKEKLLADLCTGMITTAEAVHAAAGLSLSLTAPFYSVVLTDVRCGRSQSAEIDAGLVDRAEARLREGILRFGPADGILEFKRSRTERAWILKGDSAERLRETLAYAQSELKAGVEAETGCSLGIGIGGVQQRLQHVHSSFLEAEEDKHWRRLTAQSRRTAGAADGSLEQAAFLDRQRYVDFLKVGSPADAEAFVSALAGGLRSIDWRSDLYGYYLLSDLTIEAFQTAKSLYRNLDGLESALRRFQQAVGEIASWEDASRYLLWLAEQFWAWRGSAADRYADMLEQVKAYIGAHYGEDRLSLQDVADHVRVSPSHLSKVFSQETGQTFIEFLTQTRIRKAMELLLTTNGKSYEIAHQVGYGDAHYFSNLFKKVTGMTTKDFRKQGRLDAAWPGWEGENHERTSVAEARQAR